MSELQYGRIPALEKQLDQAIERQGSINLKVDELNEKLFDYETEIVEVSTNNEIAGELGPLKYLSGLTGTPMDKIINILLLTIIFVFDPLAIALVIAANFAFERLKGKTKETIYGETIKIEEKEFDEDHALDTVMNDMVEDLTEEEIEEVEDVVEVEEVIKEEKKEEEKEPASGYKDPSQLSSWRRRKIEEEGKRYW